jgi:transposase
VIPELFRKPSLVDAVVHRPTFALKRGLLREPGVVVADVPKLAASTNGAWLEPKRAVGVVPIAGVHVVSVRALVYAQSLQLDSTSAVYFSFDEDDVQRIQRDWWRVGLDVPLDVVDAPCRDLGAPLLTHVRRITADPDLMRRRRCTAEHPFGTLKASDAGRFLTRGLDKVTTEFSLSVLAYNFRRALALLGPAAFLAALA